MKYRFHADAVQELNSAIDYYESQDPGLGAEFLDEVNSAIQAIIALPEAWTKVYKECRRCLTRRFPFGIIYLVKDEEIVIVAVMQLNRKPKYWKERVED